MPLDNEAIAPMEAVHGWKEGRRKEFVRREFCDGCEIDVLAVLLRCRRALGGLRKEGIVRERRAAG